VLDEPPSSTGGALPFLKPWDLKKSDITYSISQLLGSGSYGAVYRGTLFHQPVAVKTFNISMGPSGISKKGKKELENFKRECSLMTKLLHPNVLLFMGLCVDLLSDTVLIVTELMKGSVYGELHRRGRKEEISFRRRMKWAQEAAVGMNYLHNRLITHLDFKTENLLLDRNDTVKVADFGLSKVKTEIQKGFVGSPPYMAPEILNEEEYDGQSADVYSYGIVLHEIVTTEIPYKELACQPGFILKLYNHVVKRGGRLEITNMNETLEKLIRKCWDKDPKKRGNFEEIVSSSVFETVLIDTIITNPLNSHAKQFWLSHLLPCTKKKQGVVGECTWEEFFESAVGYCRWSSVDINSCEYRALRSVFAVNNIVTIERFNQVIEWFGPFEKNTVLLENILEILSVEGFHGDVSTKGAISILAGHKTGSYIIRFSSSGLGNFTISSVEGDKKLRSVRIEHKINKGFSLGSRNKRRFFG